jgi:hypothetical protein
VLAAFVRALPHALRGVASPEGATVRLTITGAAGGEWFAVRGDRSWALSADADTPPIASVTMDQETAWRLFTKGRTKQGAQRDIIQQGDPVLTARMLDMVSMIV